MPSQGYLYEFGAGQKSRGFGLIEAHLRPQPRLREARRILEASGGRASLMDTSDGLADALVQICEASGVSMQINSDFIPISDRVSKSLAAAFGGDALSLALYGGEDYELVGTCAESDVLKSVTSFKGDAPIVAIGKVIASKEPGRPLVELLTPASHAPNGQNTVSLVDLEQLL